MGKSPIVIEDLSTELIGEKFGEWTVIGPGTTTKYQAGTKVRRVEVKCSCGETRLVSEYSLKVGESKSCGHVAWTAKDLTGQKFGWLTVTKRLDETEPSNGSRLYECTCLCGKTKVLPSTTLLSKKTGFDCGCRYEFKKKYPKFATVHRRLKVQRGPASAHRCVVCGSGAKDWALQDATGNNQHQLWELRQSTGEPMMVLSYSTDLDQYVPMCRKCHRRYDMQRVVRGHSVGEYEKLLRRIMFEGLDTDDRTGTGTRHVFGASLRFDLSDGRVPLVGTKKVGWRSATAEILWQLRGDTNVSGLVQKYTRSDGSIGTIDTRQIWTPWADADGELGPVYGSQFRGTGSSHGVDQLAYAVNQLKKSPNSRRAVVNLWQAADLSDMSLPPCPNVYHFVVHGGRLNLSVWQRSTDAFLGLPYDLYEFSVVARLVADELGLPVGVLDWSGSDVHVYSNHFDQVNAQLERPIPRFPVLSIRKGHGSVLELVSNADSITLDDFELSEYEPTAPAIRAPLAV